jgi:hypothetical protein
MREPERMSPDKANDWFARKMLLRQPGDKWSIKEPLPFPDAHRSNADHVFRPRSRRMNFEYDMKRRPLNPEPRYVSIPDDPDPIVQHVASDTVPWQTVEEFTKTRELFDGWRLKSAGCLKTIADWHRWQDFQMGSEASAAGVRRSAKGPVEQARKIVVRAYRRAEWGLPGRDYTGAATRLTAAGYPTPEHDLKNAGRIKKLLPEHAIRADAPGVREFVRAVCTIWPEFEWWRLVHGAGADYLREVGAGTKPAQNPKIAQVETLLSL